MENGKLNGKYDGEHSALVCDNLALLATGCRSPSMSGEGGQFDPHLWASERPIMHKFCNIDLHTFKGDHQ